MKKNLTLILALALGTTSLLAYDYTSSANGLNTTIPDGDLNGIQSSQTLSGLSGNVIDIDVTLNLSGGFNGDFYAYLYHNSVSAILLNRVGRTSSSSVGYPDAGFGPDALANSFLFNDQAGHDVHLY